MEVIHRGFDKLELAFKSNTPKPLISKLETTKEQSRLLRQKAPLTYGGIDMLVSESGMRGGYAFVCDTGPFGGIWSFKIPNKNDPWGIRVSVKALPLAICGLGWVRADIYKTLTSLGIATSDDGVSISRVDYAIDILAPDIKLVSDNFVMHARCNRRTHEEITDISINGHSGRTTSVTVGKNPGRQVIIYDKRDEVKSKRSVEWYEIWNQNRKKLGLPALDFSKPTASRIWRVELRAYKRHLKDTWDVTAWSGLDDKLGDIYAKIVDDIRYAVPTSDNNRSRWPNAPIWKVTCAEMKKDLFEMCSGADPVKIKEVIRDEQRRVLQSQKLGLDVSLAALDDVSPAEFNKYLEDAVHIVKKLSRKHKVPIKERIAKSKAKYIFIQRESSPDG